MALDPYDLVLYVKEFNEEELGRRIDEINALPIRPRGVILVNHTYSFDNQSTYINALKKLAGMKYDLETVIDDEAATLLDSLNYAVRRVLSPFFIVFLSAKSI